MHLSLEQFNQLRSHNLSENDRVHLVEHILECDQCTSRFRLLNRLDSELRSPAVKPVRKLRYFLGVAAVLAMSAYPYLFRGRLDSPPSPEPLEMASVGDFTQEQLSLLGEVQRVNFRHALNQWGNRNDLTHIIALQNTDP